MTENDPYPDFEGGEWDTDNAREEPVDDNRCVWCKWPREEWADDVDAHEIDTGEVICSNCLKDQRCYKRALAFALTYPGQWLDDETIDEINAHFDDIVAAADGNRKPAITSNATGREVVETHE